MSNPTASQIRRNGVTTDLRDHRLPTSVGSNGQVLSANNGNIEWKDADGNVNDVTVNGTSVVSNKVAVVTVPTKTSDITNDSGYITSSAISGKEDASNKVVSISTQSTDIQYPSAKAVYTELNQKEPADATILKQANIVNTTSSTSTTQPLSANMGKELQDQVNNLKNIGRFLSIWNANTGDPTSEPTVTTYEYKVGDYYRIGTEGTKNPAPNSTYTVGGTNWVEGDSLKIGDVLYISNISGTTATWVKQEASGGGKIQDVQVNGTSVVDANKVAQVTVPVFIETTLDDYLENEATYSLTNNIYFVGGSELTDVSTEAR